MEAGAVATSAPRCYAQRGLEAGEQLHVCGRHGMDWSLLSHVRGLPLVLMGQESTVAGGGIDGAHTGHDSPQG